jgi:hypothetical protein
LFVVSSLFVLGVLGPRFIPPRTAVGRVAAGASWTTLGEHRGRPTARAATMARCGGVPVAKEDWWAHPARHTVHTPAEKEKLLTRSYGQRGERRQARTPHENHKNAGNAKYVPGKSKSRRPSGTVHATAAPPTPTAGADTYIAVDLFPPPPGLWVPLGRSYPPRPRSTAFMTAYTPGGHGMKQMDWSYYGVTMTSKSEVYDLCLGTKLTSEITSRQRSPIGRAFSSIVYKYLGRRCYYG